MVRAKAGQNRTSRGGKRPPSEANRSNRTEPCQFKYQNETAPLTPLDRTSFATQ